MRDTSVRPTDDIEEIVNIYSDMLFRICFVMLKNSADAEDAVQETFIKLFQKKPDFESKEHEKAWLIRVATNKSYDMLRSNARRNRIDEQQASAYFKNEEAESVAQTIMDLPEKFKIVLVLFYVEGYKVSEISEILQSNDSVIKKKLQKGRKLFEEKYRKECM